MDTVSSKQRSGIMARVRSSGNRSTELLVVSLFRTHRINGWRRNHPLPGKPDFAFPKQRLVVFVDGCFWHGCPKHCRMPSTNREYWNQKITRNTEHDKSINHTLRKQGWRVIRFWEHELCGGAALAKKLRMLKEIVQ